MRRAPQTHADNRRANRRQGSHPSGMTFLEAMLAVAILALMVGIVSLPWHQTLRQTGLRQEVHHFARTLRAAAEHAILSGQTLAVVIEVEASGVGSTYTVYPAAANDLYDADDTPALIDLQFLPTCWIDEIEWEDGSKQYSGEAVLKATPQGWKNSLLLTITDSLDPLEKNMYYLRCDGLTSKVVVSRQPLEMPQAYTDLSIDTPM